MTPTMGLKWFAGFVATGLVLLLVSLFVADRRLTPPFQEVPLGPIDVPVGQAMPASMVLYTSDQGGNLEIYARAFDGGDPIVLTSDPNYASLRPRISPDRRTVLFYRQPVGGAVLEPSQASLWMVAADGGEPVEVLPVGAHGWMSQAGAEWAPSGDELVMTGGRPLGTQIWVTSVDGRAVRSLVNDPGDNLDPTWSSNGKRVLYVSCPEVPCEATDQELYVVLALGGDPIRLTSNSLAERQPQFSPDGTEIVMRTRVTAPDENGEGEVWDIRAMPTNRSEGPRKLVGDVGPTSAPYWFDDATVLFHSTGDDADTIDVLAARATDGRVTPVVTGTAAELYPSS